MEDGAAVGGYIFLPGFLDRARRSPLDKTCATLMHTGAGASSEASQSKSRGASLLQLSPHLHHDVGSGIGAGFWAAGPRRVETGEEQGAWTPGGTMMR